MPHSLFPQQPQYQGTCYHLFARVNSAVFVSAEAELLDKISEQISQPVLALFN